MVFWFCFKQNNIPLDLATFKKPKLGVYTQYYLVTAFKIERLILTATIKKIVAESIRIEAAIVRTI